MVDYEAWMRDPDNMARFVAEAFPLFIRAIALDDDAWTDRAREAWDKKALGIEDYMLRGLFDVSYIGDEYWGFVSGDIKKAYLAEHPAMEFEQYEPAFRATESWKRWCEWCKNERAAAQEASEPH
jgi:hypothetical protein